MGVCSWAKGGLMTKKQLLEEIKAEPSRYFRTPNDVIRDRRFSDPERLDILLTWERVARSGAAGNEGENEANRARLESIIAARLEVEKKLPAQSD
jgi:hypothetical protein